MADPKVFGPEGLIKTVIGCDDETAATVARNLGGIMKHEATRAFIARAWHLSTTTHNPKASQNNTLINEGKRQAALFLVACERGGLDLKNYENDGGTQ